MTLYSRGLQVTASVAALTLALAAAPAFAQTTTDSANGTTDAQQTAQDGPTEVVVTGSRIARPEFDTVQPTQTVGAAQIESRGYTNVGQALREIPSFGPPGNSSVAVSCRRTPRASSARFRRVRRST